MAGKGETGILTLYSDVQATSVRWLWYPFIPYGKLTIIQGDPGDGKTTMVLNLAAKLSKGEALDKNNIAARRSRRRQVHNDDELDCGTF